MNAVIFDLGRVLIEYNQQQTLDALATVCSVDEQEVRRLLHSVAKKLDIGELTAAGFHKFMIEQAGATSDYSTFETAFCSSMARNEMALNYALQLQKNGVKVGIISNTNEGHARFLRRMLPEFAQFDDVILSNEVALRKPDAAIYQLSLRNLAVQAQNAIFVDDIAENVEAARSVGMIGIVHNHWTETAKLIAQSLH